jgi:ribonuclease-3
MNNEKIDDFLEKIEYQFQDRDLLKEALTHPSYSKDKKLKNYQRLEFLGDAILSMLISDILLDTYLEEKEGLLSKRQAYLVSGNTISKIAAEIDLGEIMLFSQSEENNNGRTNKRNLENCLEALIGAIYKDSGLENCKKFIRKFWQKFVTEDLRIDLDPISNLQEIVQAKSKKLPKYQISRVGGDEHDPIFSAVIEIDNQRYAARGSSKKEAQKNAALHAISTITNSSNK